jgi:BirA family transcriptional regulator, biotin operon repressor / biotin---[acetyl-CoA-carboxylase] ligase
MNEKIIKLLKDHIGFLSGQRMSEKLGLSRAAVWKHIEQLRDQGYAIEAVSRKGYRLTSAPDKLLVGEIKNGLKTKIFGKQIFSYDSIGSTMDEVMRLGLADRSEGVVVCADGQTKGRGRLGRRWESKKGRGLFFSILLRPRLSVIESARLTLVFAVALCEALRKIARVEAQIKWPNDILIHGKKVAGILTEMNAEMDRVNFIVVGVGVNVLEGEKDLLASATSIFLETQDKISRVRILQEILFEVERYYHRFQDKEFSSICNQWRKSSATLGQRIRLGEGRHAVEGIAKDIDSDGCLLIRTDQGSIVKRTAGDVVHLS